MEKTNTFVVNAKQRSKVVFLLLYISLRSSRFYRGRDLYSTNGKSEEVIYTTCLRSVSHSAARLCLVHSVIRFLCELQYDLCVFKGADGAAHDRACCFPACFTNKSTIEFVNKLRYFLMLMQTKDAHIKLTAKCFNGLANAYHLKVCIIV